MCPRVSERLRSLVEQGVRRNRTAHPPPGSPAGVGQMNGEAVNSTTSLCATCCLLGTFPEQTTVVQQCKEPCGSAIGSYDTLGVICTLDAEFTRFVAETETTLYRHAYRLCGNHAQAQDLVQSGYLKTWTSWLAHGPKDPDH